MIILFSLILTADNFIDEDFKNGSLKELQFLGFSAEQIFIAKSLSMLVSIVLSNFFLIPLTSLFFGINFSIILNIFLIFLISSPTLVLLSLISALFSLQIKRNKFIQFIIVTPFFIPIIIFASSMNISDTENSNNVNFLILFGFFLITLPLSIIIGKLLIKETNQ
jgi:heme exporter protein B